MTKDNQEKIQEIREEAEYKKHHSQLARHCLFLLTELDAAKQTIQRLIEARDSYFRQRNEYYEVAEALQQQLDAATAERDKYRQEAMNERELSESIVAERERLIIENEQLRTSEVFKCCQAQEEIINELRAELDAAKQENERLLHRNESLFNEIEDYQQRLKQAIEALEWYADEETHRTYADPVEHRFSCKLIDSDKGNKAKRTLFLIRGENEELNYE